MRTSPLGRSFVVALAAGAAAVVLSLGPPASANHGAPHASDQGQSSSSANSQSAEHAQNDRAGNDEAPAQQAAGAGAAGNGDTQGASGSNPDGGGIDKPWCGTDGNLECQGTSDFDGNNGCGNDADREDDNNGNCGGGPVKAKECPPASAKASVRGVERADERSRIRQCASAANSANSANSGSSDNTTPVAGTTAEVAGTNSGRPTDTANILASVAAAAGTTTAGGSGAQDATQVLGVSFERQAAPDQAGSPAASPAQVKGIQFERGQLGRTGLHTALLVLIALGLVGAGASLKRLAHRP